MTSGRSSHLLYRGLSALGPPPHIAPLNRESSAPPHLRVIRPHSIHRRLSGGSDPREGGTPGKGGGHPFLSFWQVFRYSFWLKIERRGFNFDENDTSGKLLTCRIQSWGSRRLKQSKCKVLKHFESSKMVDTNLKPFCFLIEKFVFA